MTRDPDPSVVAWHLVLSPRPAPAPRRHWWRELVTNVYRDARDAREALRETGRYSQHERDEFDAEHPPVTLGQVMRDLSSGREAPPNWGWGL